MPKLTNSQYKSQLRQQAKQSRMALNANQINKHSQAVIEFLTNTEFWQQAQHIGLYLPFNNEIDLRSLLELDKVFYLPSINGPNMQFQAYKTGIQLTTTEYGLRQPKFIEQHPIASLDLCLMPLLGFDENANRLGMGGGFYDRYFEHKRHTYLVGVAHASQQFNQLPIDPWDVKLHAIITEQGIIHP